MVHNNGFTLIEMLILIAIVGILAAVAFAGFNTGQGNVSWNLVGGMQQTTCISGFQFTVNQRGYTTQILGADGKPLPCN